MKKLLNCLNRMIVVAGLGIFAISSLFPAPVSAASCTTPTGDKPLFCYHGPRIIGGDDGTLSLQEIMKILFGSLGAISVIVIIYAGMRLTISRGNPEAIGKLRNTIIYAGVGLFVAIGATAILQFVIKGVQS